MAPTRFVVPVLFAMLLAQPAEARWSPRQALGSARQWLAGRRAPGVRRLAPAPQVKAPTKPNLTKGYLDPGYRPTGKDMVVVYRVEPAGRMPIKKVAEHLAAESSIGTWTDISTANPASAERLRPHIFSISKRGKRAHYVKIAYPEELFETGSIPQILSSVAGNIFGMKEVKRLRLVDLSFSDGMLKSLPGPAFGIEGVRQKAGVTGRPMVGTIVKPKVGLSPREHAKVCYDAWTGGLDLVKDDENLTSQPFNQFKARMKETFRSLKQAEKATGQKKVYVPNVSAETGEMLKRAKLVKKLGGTTVMVDILTVGWSGIETLRKANLGLVIHGHRAGHAAMTRDPTHGISMLALAKVARAAGIDQLHVGTAGVGKMHGEARDVQRIQQAISSKTLRANSIYLGQDWGKMKPTLPIASGGLQPGQMEKLIDRMGTNIVAQFGGGCHGHPSGTVAGARAIRQAVDAKMTGVPLRDYARSHLELNQALTKWGVGK